MSDTNRPDDANSEIIEKNSSEVEFRYAQGSAVILGDDTTISLAQNSCRGTLAFEGTVKEPLPFREAMASLYAVVGSDYRYAPKDMSAYQMYRKLKSQTSALSAWEAQKAYYEWIAKNDPLAACILDPIITVHPDEVLFEVFSKDESCYATVSMKRNCFTESGESVCGTTNIDFSAELFSGMEKIKSSGTTAISLAKEEVTFSTDEGTVLSKKISIPDSWLRSFLQVQSSAVMMQESFKLAPIDLYNILRHLRMHADQKGKKRGLRVELVPGQFPTVVLEPWGTVIQTSSQLYAGKEPKIVRVWGRRRLMLLKRFLPFIQEAEVYVSSSGLPSFWVLRGKNITFTLGMTGFTVGNWSQALNFDLLLPRKTEALDDMEKVVAHLKTVWVDSEKNISKATELKGQQLQKALQLGCQQGLLSFDIAESCYRYRPILESGVDYSRLEFRNVHERHAHDLIAQKGAVKITTENRIYGTGIELTGKVIIADEKREYQPKFLISEDGHIGQAECTCNHFRKQGIKQGPCSHLIALRIAYALEDGAKKKNRKGITVETRTFRKRQSSGEAVYIISLNHSKIKTHWGTEGETLRMQHLHFNSEDAARSGFFAKIEELGGKGYLEVTAG